MKSRFRTACLLLIIASVAGLGATWLLPNKQAPPAHVEKQSRQERTSTTRKPMPRMSVAPDVPKKLYIEKLSINTSLVGVGMSSKGEMKSPDGRLDTVWYKHGYLPGSLGSAVIAAHSWHKQGQGLFYELHKLSPGDKITVDTADHRLYFTVTDSKSYPLDTTLLEEVFGASDKAKLNLITCSGSWDEAMQQYQERLVVFTEFSHEQRLP